MYTRVLRSTKRLCRVWWLEYTTPAGRRRAAVLGGLLRHVLGAAAIFLLLIGLLGAFAVGGERLFPRKTGRHRGAHGRHHADNATASPLLHAKRPHVEHWSMLLPGRSRGNTSSDDKGFEDFLSSVVDALRLSELGVPCLDFAMAELAPQLDHDSLWLEFGVWMGNSLEKLGKRSHELGRKRKVFGFDSFRGLPENWRTSHGSFSKAWEQHFTLRGAFDMKGQPPEFFVNTDNVDFVVGWFNESLPAFLKKETGPVSLLHIDSDLYSSALTVLNLIGPRLRPGSVIIFDELVNYAGFRGGEVRALYEWLESPGFADAGHTGLQVIGYRGPNLLTSDSELEVALKAQGKEGRSYPQDAVFRLW